MIKIYTILIFLIFPSLSAEIIQKLDVQGNNRISDETIRVYGDIETGKNYTAFEVNEIIKKLYDTDFFKDLKVSLTNGVLKITVKEYSLINFIDLQGEKSNKIKEGVLEKLQLRSKESFIENKLNQDMNLIKKIYATLGYNFVRVESKIERFDDNRVNLI